MKKTHITDVSSRGGGARLALMPGFSVPDEGVTMQSGPILRCSDMVASTAAAAAACAKRRKKKKKRKQKRPHALVSPRILSLIKLIILYPQFTMFSIIKFSITLRNTHQTFVLFTIIY